MFRHKGKSRTFIHNLRLAAILSLIAGIVNICGVLAIRTLTTNITGHFAFFAEEMVKGDYTLSLIFLIYILAFLAGAFLSNLLIEGISRIRPQVSHAVPMILEISLLSIVGFANLPDWNGHLIACLLLLAMGMQNSLVTQISQSRVRTTHLTGLFTDLGIELSQFFFYRERDERKKLSRSVFLRLVIILFFFLGCIGGGFIYQVLGIRTLLVAVMLLIIALFYDAIRYRIYLLRRKM